MAGLNCRAGDMAVVVKGHPQSLGQSVTCLRLLAPGETVSIGGYDQPLPREQGACWLVEPPVLWLVRLEDAWGEREFYALAPYCPDRCLMPIRPKPDEECIDAVGNEVMQYREDECL